MAKKKMREFSSGATRDLDEHKIDFEGVLAPEVLLAFGEYMTRHRKTANGIRESDNWQQGFGDDHFKICMKSMLRHAHDLWMEHRGFKSRDGIEEAINGVIFNAMAYYQRWLKENKYEKSKTK